MTVTTENLTQEKNELESVLSSGIFDRSPSLVQLLSYVCQKHFEGTADEIKEYNIAVDVLGRPTDFDQKRDSIVRVHFHRLRNRLAVYYAKEGATRPLRILIPPGQYIPQFVPQVGGEDVPAQNNEAVIAAPLQEAQALPKSRPDSSERPRFQSWHLEGSGAGGS